MVISVKVLKPHFNMTKKKEKKK